MASDGVYSEGDGAGLVITIRGLESWQAFARDVSQFAVGRRAMPIDVFVNGKSAIEASNQAAG